VNPTVEPQIDLTVIIPCRNGGAFISHELDAIAAQHFSGTHEVVVVDNGSRDNTREVVGSFVPRIPTLRIVDASTRAGRNYACNVGARHARGRLITFVDADDRIAPGYLQAIVRALDDYPIVAARIDHSLDAEWMRGVGSDVQSTGLQNGFDFLAFGSGGTLGFRKSVFDELGGFSDSATLCEDIDLCWRAQLAGYHIGFVADAVLFNVGRTSMRGMYRQHRNYARAWPVLYRKYRGAGMPRRTTRDAVAEWIALGRSVPRLGTATELARWVRRLGRNVGRIEGSIRHRTWFP
jgi:cellulose synthase/poly-beta-1,6-N-acetylglucosamine synthase-like glycosyltransferase